jgi:hypothetical protein
MADTTPTALASTPAVADPTIDDVLGALSGIMGTNTAKGAALGALMSKILSGVEAPGGVNQGVDMSKVGNIASRAYTTSAPRFIPYSDYGTRTVEPTITPELARALGIPMGANNAPLIGGLKSVSDYSTTPNMFRNFAPQTITAQGTGVNKNITPTLSARGENTIDPLTGVLLGGALGYLMPESQSYAKSGASGTGSNAVNTLMNYGSSGLTGFLDTVKKIPGYSDVTNWFNKTPTSSYVPEDASGSNTSSSYFAEGGMATPLMADGGEAQAPSYYTFGEVVNPQDILNQMAQGGQPRQGGLHVPTVEGRHDYREGSRVTGQGDGQSDDIPAMLADGEYVFDADTVAQLGNGSTKAGSDLLDKFREEIRAHKRSAPINKIPPPAKSPLAYMKAAQSRSKKNG